MRQLRRRTALLMAAAALVFSACGGNGTASVGAPALQQSASGVSGDTGTLDVGGEYSGKIVDNKYGKGTATAALAQYRGAVGGEFTYTYGTASVVSETTALLSSGGGLRGASVAVVLSTACTYRFAAQYDATSYTLKGTYKAVNGCTGEKGTFLLTEQCYYTGDWFIARRNGGGLMHC